MISIVVFGSLYLIDKYNLMYYYPLEFESSSVSRKLLIKNSFYAVLLFQVVMISIGILRTVEDNDGNLVTLITVKSAVYMYSLVLVQLIVILTIFEFMRKPWEGAELPLEDLLHF